MLLTPWAWPSWCWPWVAGLSAVAVEAYFRTHRGVPYYQQWIPMLLGVAINYGVYKIMVSASSLLAGFIAFSTATLILRILVTIPILREPVSVGTWAALALVMLAKTLIR